MKDIAAKIARLAALNPDAAELGRRLSLAARIDTHLVRQARLLAPHLHASAESDLWFSDLVEAQTPLGFALLAEVAAELRSELARRPEMLDRAWRLISGAHQDQPLSIRMEEMVNRLSLSDAPEDAQQIEDLLSAAAHEMVRAGKTNRGWARWMVKAIARLPPAVRDSGQGRVLGRGAGLRLHGRIKEEPDSAGDNAQRDWLSWLLADGIDDTVVDLRLGGGRLDLGALGTDREQRIAIPATDPLVLELSWHDGERARQETVRLPRGGRVTLPVSANRVEIASLSGARWRLSEIGHEGDVPSLMDFSAVRAAHRPFLAREALVTELIGELAPGSANSTKAQTGSQLFVSYSVVDEEQMERLSDVLGRELDRRFPGQLRLWIGKEEVKAGAEIDAHIDAAIGESFAVILLETQAALDSEWVRDEIRKARERAKPIFPVRVEEVSRPPESELNDLQGVDLVGWDGAPDAREFQRLIQAIEELWARSQQPRGTLLQIEGASGTGKTALLCRLLDLMEDQGRPCIHYFADSGPVAWRTSEAMAASLCAQLQGFFPSLPMAEAPIGLKEVGELLLTASDQQETDFDLTLFVDAIDEVAESFDLAAALNERESTMPSGLNLVMTRSSETSLESVIGDRARHVVVDLDQKQESNTELCGVFLERQGALLERLLPPGRMSANLMAAPDADRNLIDELRARLQSDGFAVLEPEQGDQR